MDLRYFSGGLKENPFGKFDYAKWSTGTKHLDMKRGDIFRLSSFIDSSGHYISIREYLESSINRLLDIHSELGDTVLMRSDKETKKDVADLKIKNTLSELDGMGSVLPFYDNRQDLLVQNVMYRYPNDFKQYKGLVKQIVKRADGLARLVKTNGISDRLKERKKNHRVLMYSDIDKSFV